jgi:hypothetical protein
MLLLFGEIRDLTIYSASYFLVPVNLQQGPSRLTAPISFLYLNHSLPSVGCICILNSLSLQSKETQTFFCVFSRKKASTLSYPAYFELSVS